MIRGVVLLGSRLAVLALLLLPESIPTAAASARMQFVPKWDRFEHAFKSLVIYSNAVQDASLKAVFTSPLGEISEVDGFWDGGKIWRVRFSPEQPGRWTFKTTCSDVANDGLNNQTGEFTCTSPVGLTRFHKHGPVRVARDQRHLEHADGTPFFWLADTIWNGARSAELKDWEFYAGIRASQRFSVAQWAAAPGEDTPSPGASDAGSRGRAEAETRRIASASLTFDGSSSSSRETASGPLGSIICRCVATHHKFLSGLDLSAAIPAQAPLFPLVLSRLFPGRAGLAPGGVWIQGVSLGEVEVSLTLAAELSRARPGLPLLMTATTPAGVGLLSRRAWPAGLPWRPFPLDLPSAVRYITLFIPNAMEPNQAFLGLLRRRQCLVPTLRCWLRIVSRVSPTNSHMASRYFSRPRVARVWPFLARILSSTNWAAIEA